MSSFHLYQLTYDRILDASAAERTAYFQAMLKGRVCEAVALGLYQKVAFIVGVNLNEIFSLTTHVTSNWTSNPCVVWHTTNVRSTAVGDIIMDADSEIFYFCSRSGWDCLTEYDSFIFKGSLN